MEAVITPEELADLERVVEGKIKVLTDKLTDFWDFYALVLIPDGFSPYADSLRRVLLFTMTKEYISHLEREVWDEVWTTRFPHKIGRKTTEDGKRISLFDLEVFTKKTGVTWENIQSMLQGEKTIPLEQLELFFRYYHFPETYGGVPWADITRGLIRLKSCKTDGDKIVYLDHIHDLHHNCGSVMDKWSFVDEEMLLQKKHMQPRDLLRRVDKDVRKELYTHLSVSKQL